MTTARRIRRDRRRYNALRELALCLSRRLPELSHQGGGWPLRWPPYNAQQAQADVLVFRGWSSCACGRRRQSIRLR
jgi:hypothetical protein